MMNFAKNMQPKSGKISPLPPPRLKLTVYIEVLDIGCYTGLSSMAWYEGTKETGAQVLLFPTIVCGVLTCTDPYD
jgi:hypothetical protein